MSEDTATLPDGRTLRLLNARVLVEILPEEKSIGLLVVPDTVVKSVHRRGVVRAVGYIWEEGRRVPIPGIHSGDHCVFVRFYANTHTNEQIQESIGENLLIMEPKDLLVVCSADDVFEV
jgi:co-chaperonin GroES (HSP10)